MDTTMKIGINNEPSIIFSEPRFDEIKIKEEYKLQWDHDYCKQTFMQIVTTNENETDTSFKCIHCKMLFRCHSDLIQHLKSHDGSPLQCTLCLKTCRSVCSLNYHLKVHSGIRPFKCGICNKDFMVNNHLKRHLVTHQKLTNSVRQSIKLQKKSNLPWDHNYSMRIKFKRKMLYNIESRTSFECVHCKKVFVNYNELSQHLKIHSGFQQFACTLCSKTFRNIDTLNIHGKTAHSDARLFKCGICDEEFASNYTLSKHVSAHEEEILKCEQCKRSFFTHKELKAHIDLHVKINLKCTLCPKTFKQVCHLNRHFKRHLGIRQFTCSICNKSLASNSSYKQHLKRHGRIKPFKCEKCNCTYSTKESLDDHVKVHNRKCGILPITTKLVPCDFYTMIQRKKKPTTNGEDTKQIHSNVIINEIKLEEEFQPEWSDDYPIQSLVKIETPDDIESHIS
ncbi:hypothetical protein RN001_011068 [Aquatica leii]|uniref:C2H2-type domain-containing protein n=1 Tax=Aquatica leii TaxID=1421715 RepID=A0AAN7P7F8_9COLE|nr:hypothetical protein RN001_011068 [Aquatica leii]